MKFSPCGLATGIGSLPHTDPAAAISIIKECLPVIPHWPQLPRSTEREFYYTQFLQVLLDLGLLRVEKGTRACFPDEDPDWLERLASFYELYLQAAEGDSSALRRFAFPPGAAEGFYHFFDELHRSGLGRARYLKGQVVGLLTAGFQITDQKGVPSYYNQQLRDVILKQLSLQAAWQVQTLGEFGLPVIIFLDDPVIDSCGRYDRIGVDKGKVQAELAEFAAYVRNSGGLAGVHSCSDLDWSLLLEADIDVVSFDAYQFAASFLLFPELVQGFLEKGGVIAWGIVPTDGKALSAEGVKSLLERMRRLLRELVGKGVDPRLLYSQSLVTPACGAGTLTETQAERIYHLTAGLARDWESIFQ